MGVVKPIQEENRQKNSPGYYGDAGGRTFDFWGCLPPSCSPLFSVVVYSPNDSHGIGLCPTRSRG